MGIKTTIWIFQMINRQNLTQEDLDMAKKEKPQKRNWISSNSSTKIMLNRLVMLKQK